MLDTGGHPKRELDRHVIETLPLTPHEFHGEWNYTLAPLPPACAPPSVARRREALPAAAAMDLLTDPVLTGMRREQLNELATRFEPAWPALAETLFQERYGRPRVHPFKLAHKGNFGTFDRILITLLYLRGVVNLPALATLYDSDTPRVSRLKQETARLFELFNIDINPLPDVTRARNLDELRELAQHLAANSKIQPMS